MLTLPLRDIFVDIGANLLILVALSYLLSRVLVLVPQMQKWSRGLLLGVALGGISGVLVLHAVEVAPGVFIDLRNVVVLVAAMIAGPLAAAVAAAMSLLFRMMVGPGLIAAGTVIATALILGLAANRLFRDLSITVLVGLGALLGILQACVPAMLAAFGAFDLELALALLKVLVPLALLVFPLASLAMGGLLRLERRRDGEAAELRARNETLAELDARTKAVFDFSSAAMMWVTPQGRIVSANRRMAGLVGYPVEELQAMHYADLLPSEDHDEYFALIDAQRATGVQPPDRERRYLCKDGSIVWGLRSITLVKSPDNAVRHKFVMIQDITARKLGEEKIRFQAMLLESVGEAVIAIDRQGSIIFCNRVAEMLLGWPAAEMIGQPIGMLLPQVHDRFGTARIAARIASEKPLAGEFPVKRRDGSAFIARVMSSPVRDAEGSVVGAVVAAADVTSAKRAERALREERRTLAILNRKAAHLYEEARQEIDTRRRAEALLEKSEARFRDFAETGSDLLWETDSSFRYTSIVGDCRSVFGASEADMIGLTPWECARADMGAEAWIQNIRDYAARQPFRNFEHQVIDAAGATRWISTNARPFYGASGEFLGFRGASTSIAARKHAEARLASSARQQQSTAVLSQLALQGVPRDHLYDVAVEIVTRTLNIELVGILELSADQRLLKLRTGTGWPPQITGIGAVPVDFCEPLARGVASDVPVHFSRRNFNLLPGLENDKGSGVAIPIGERPVRSGLIVVCSEGLHAFSETDINFLRAVSFVLAADAEQRKAADQLRLRDRAMESIGEGIMITDATQPDNPLIYVNPAFERVTGYAAEDVLGRNARFLQGKHTDRDVVRAVRAAVESGNGFRGSLLNCRKDGTPFWNLLTVSPIRDAKGDTSHYVGIMSDETERVNLSSQLRQAQKMESLGHLTGGVAHDFNNLLAVILGNSEILHDEMDTPELKEIAELIMNTAEKGADLTQRLLAFGRRQALHPEPFILGDVIGSLSGMLNRTLGDHITLRVESEARRPASVDRSLFESAILNLTLNARDAMPNGGLVTIRTEIIDLRQGYALGVAPGEYVRVSVSDTGEGMAQEVVERAFEPFFTTKSVGKGSGMGLAMVYGFAKQSGGHVTIESHVGHGTSVQLYLPVAAEASATRPVGTLRAAELRGGSERVLLVEDEPKLRRFVSAQLRALGYHVIEAEAGAPAIEILKSGTDIDVVFSDVMMPGGMSGFDLVERARVLRPGLKVLLTTGYVGETDRIADIRAPILKKPYKKQQLAEALRSVLDGPRSSAA